MQWMTRSATLALLIGLAIPSIALASGGPVQPVQGSAIGVPGGASSYGAFGTGGATVVKRLGAGGVPTGPRLRLAGRYGIPGVDYNGTTTGLAANGRTLILAQMTPNGRAPRVTRLVVVNTPRLTVRTRITLPGWSTVDAISPDGRWLYLIHYRSQNVINYEVRAYDLLRGRMLATPIVDPHDADEPMAGFAAARVMSPGSRWAYTLYLRPSGAPFVHALDTVGRRAVCIDLAALTNDDLGNGHLRLSSGGALLHIDVAGTTRALINTRTLAVVRPVAAAPRSAASSPARPGASSAPSRRAAHHGAGHRSGGVPWGLIAGLIAALGVLAVGVHAVRAPGRGVAASKMS
jgi:hypothetical protein